MKDLSVLIVSYNTKDLLLQTISSLTESLANTSNITYEVIVIDNGSQDGSVDAVKSLKDKRIVLIENNENVGFGKANNIAAKKATGKFLLLLNSDTIVNNVNFETLLNVMDEKSGIGLLTVSLVLPNGNIDPASHRGFPTLWRSFTYFSKLEHVTKPIPVLNRMFGGYHLTHLNRQAEHEIESPSGAFFLTRKEIYDKLGGFDEAFFMYGEDLDLAWRIKEAGYKVWYYPHMSIVHIKGQSGRKNVDSKKKSATRKYFYEAMKIFYRKHYEKQYPAFVNSAVYKILDSKI